MEAKAPDRRDGEPERDRRVVPAAGGLLNCSRSLIDAPSDLGLRPTGVRELPQALRDAGILEGLHDVHYEEPVRAPRYDPARDAATGVLNPDGIRTFSLQLADPVGAILELGRFPIVLGGDCSILIGTALALRRRGRYGLLFLDGHSDFYSPETEPNGEVASMELAIVTGREPAALADLDGFRPLVREEDIVVFGYRDAETAAQYGSPDVRATSARALTLEDVRGAGVIAAARDAVAALETSGAKGFWIHLDADVLNDAVMPAVDYRMPDGLWPDELVEVLTVALASPFAIGIEITIYNPRLDDEHRSAARVLAECVRRATAAS